MPVYTYRGIDLKGKTKKGLIEADNIRTAKEKLRSMDIYILDIKETSETTRDIFSRIKKIRLLKKITGEEILNFTTQLSSLLKSGIPLYEALSAILEQTGDVKFKSVVSSLKDSINEGSSLADALEKHRDVFSELYINMIRAGESSGALEIVLERLADYMESQSNVRRKVLTAMIYPAMITTVMLIVIWVLMSFVIPRISKIFEDVGQSLPIYTRILISISGFLSEWWYLTILFVGIVVYGIRRYAKTRNGKRRFDLIKLKFPIFGSLYQKLVIARFSKTLATLLKNGVPIVRALDIVKRIVNNVWIEETIDRAKEVVEGGGALHIALKESPYFPPILIRMIAIGERSGELENMLEMVAKNFEAQIEVATNALTSILEPVLIVIMAGIVFFLIISIVMPIFQLNQLVR